MFTLKIIRKQMAANRPATFKPGAETRQAAVAIILREHHSILEMLFIERAVKEGDPWSGHMAFPGGHREPSDTGLKDAAVRETWEEIGLDLDEDTHIGAVDQQRAQPRGRLLDMIIAPHVFVVKGDPVFRINYEVAEVVWAPIPPMYTNDVHDTESRPMAGTPTEFNGYRLPRGHFVWGLTYRIVKSFFATIEPGWQGPVEID